MPTFPPNASATVRSDDIDAFSYWTFRDMHARRIVATRTDLHRKQRLFGFPKPVVPTGGERAAALFLVSEVKAWLIGREALASRNSAPEPRPGSRPRGRRRKDIGPLDGCERGMDKETRPESSRVEIRVGVVLLRSAASTAFVTVPLSHLRPSSKSRYVTLRNS